MARISRVEQWSRWLLLCVLLASQAAWAQRVLVLTLEGDKRSKLRNQIVKSLMNEDGVTLVPIKSFEQAAQRAKLKGARAKTSSAIARLAPIVEADLVIDGKVGRRAFSVRFIDSSGQEIYQRDLPVKNGLLTASNAKKLARAIVTAVGTVSPSKPAEPEKGRGQEIIVQPDPKATVTPPAGSKASPSSAGTDTSTADATSTDGTDPATPEPSEDPKKRVGPTTITLHLGGVTTWRSYCARPGVSSCGEFERLAEEDRPLGVSVSFNTPVPYAGFAFGLDLFPLARAGISGLEGLGLSGHYSRGFSLTEINRRSDTGETEPERVVSVDQAWQVSLGYRYYFALSEDDTGPLPGYVGARAGYASRSFTVDPTATVGLTGSNRSYPQLGLEVSFPLIRQARIEAGGHFFLGPRAGAEELNEYGASVQSSGFGFEAGLAGELYGPLGYEVRFRYTSFRDRFEGEGARWSEGGAAEESYASVFWGLTAGF